MTERVGRIGGLWRYPVKSMLGEALTGPVPIGEAGLLGDRRFGVLDPAAGKVGSAKRPSRWARLLQARAALADAERPAVRIRLPHGVEVLSTDRDVDKLLSEFLGREVTLASAASPRAALDRAIPDEVLDRGADADVDVTILEIAAASPAGTFFDFTPMQVLTTAALAAVAARHPAGAVDPARYRPNVIIETEPSLEGFVENRWVGRRLLLGPEVILDVLVPSPRCAIPTLRHGDLPPDPDALRVPLRHNFVEVPVDGFGSAPCLGAHCAVVQGGVVTPGDEVRLSP
ncbi:MAG TPA: MOSC domain-containing protein [Acidimicrobiia bacterium]|nr:MOSC domain-containing protein [Acidimicrobiia bacterium]